MSSTPNNVPYLYQQFEYLAKQYSEKLWDYESTGWERKDIEQEMKLKILTTIVSYRKKWKEYALDPKKRYKPIPFELYVRSALQAKVVDFIKKFNKDFHSKGRISVQNNDFDCGVMPEPTVIDFEKNTYIVRGVDLLEGLNSKEERACFSLFLKQKPMPMIKKVFKKKPIVPREVIDRQVAFLREKKNELLYEHHCLYKAFNLQED